MDLGLGCLSLLIPIGTVGYSLHGMSMFTSSVYLVLFWDHMKNLDDGLRIPFDVPFVQKFV